jgi:hypothetical protein
VSGSRSSGPGSTWSTCFATAWEDAPTYGPPPAPPEPVELLVDAPLAPPPLDDAPLLDEALVLDDELLEDPPPAATTTSTQ